MSQGKLVCDNLPEGCPACGALPCGWSGGADPHAICSNPTLAGEVEIAREFADKVQEAAAACCIDPDAGPDCQTSVKFTGEEGALIALALHRLAATPATPSEQEKLAEDELNKIAEQVGEQGDPYAAWEAIDAIIRERDKYLKALNDVARCTSGGHAVHIAHMALSPERSPK